ncbi:MAG: ACT domain-containing protein [Planctomycetota bacterium]|jgi:hypothetical protein
MDDQIRIVDCYYATVHDRPGEGSRLLEHISESGLSLTAFTAVPTGADEVQICLVTDRPDMLQKAASDAGAMLVGPKKAFLIQGEDRIGALHAYHLTLSNAGVNVYSSTGVCAGKGSFGFILWVEPEDFDKAFDAFGIGG